MKAHRTWVGAAVLMAGLFLVSPSRGQGQGLTWWVEPATHKVMQDRAPQPDHAVAIAAAGNEYEPFQVVLRADGGDLANVDADMSDLLGPRGAVIPAENVNLYRAAYVTVTSPSGNSGAGDGVAENPRAAGEYVDPLIPFFDPFHPTHRAVGTPFAITKDRLQPIFGDIYVPAGAPAGTYRGALRVTVNFVEAAQVPVTLRVFAFTLPQARRTATSYGLSFGMILWYHGGADGAYDDEARQIIWNYENTLHLFRVDITNPVQGPPGLPDPFFTFDAAGNVNPPDYTAYDSYLAERLDGSYFSDGSPAVMYNSGMFQPGTGYWPEAILTDDQYTKAGAEFARHLKERGWWDNIYVYVHDEPYLYPGALEAVAYDVVLLKMGDPDWVLKMMATNHWVPELDFVTGIWCPLTSNYDHWNSTLPQYTREDYQGLLERGDRIWFYVCNGTKPPYAGYDIDTVYGQEPRLLHWSAWYEGATGFLYWDTNYWIWSDPWTQLLDLATWPTAARNGDGFLVYPGDHDGAAGSSHGSPADVVLDGPVISHRLLMIREGMEDWDYLLLAEARGGKAVARKITERIYTQFGMNPAWYDELNPPWSYDEADLYQARRDLAEWIEASGQPPPAGWGQGDGHPGCALATTPDDRGQASGLPVLVMIAAMVAGARFAARRKDIGPGRPGGTKMKKMVKTLFLFGAAAILSLPAGCGQEGDDGRDGRVPPPIVDHAFTNATAAPGDAPADLDPNGPAVTALDINLSGRSIVIQGQAVSFNLNFSHPDADLVSAHLLVQVLGQNEYWTFDTDQFGAIIGTTAMVRIEISKYFEPGAYIILIGIQDDAGHVGALYRHVLIVLAYQTPEIVTFVPEDGATNVPLNTSVRAVFSNPVVGDTPTLVLSQGLTNVPGALRLLPNLKGLTLAPDDFLLPLTPYVATLTVGELLTGGVKTAVHRFTTGPMTAGPDLTGRVYSILLKPENILEPAGAEMIFTMLPLPPLLIKIKSFDEIGGTISSVGALGIADPMRQNPDLPNLRFPGAGAILVNPYFKMGPSVLNIDLYALSGGMFDAAINVYDFTITGRFSADGGRFEAGIGAGYIDAAEVNGAIGQFIPGPIPFDICLSLPDACDSERHLAFRAENLAGPYEPAIGDFYDLTLAVNPAAVPRAAGGVVAVSGEYLRNGDPSGVHTVTLTTTHGTFPGGVTSYNVNTAAGLYSTNLTIPAGLPAGTVITVHAVSASPIGDLNRNKKVSVQ